MSNSPDGIGVLGSDLVTNTSESHGVFGQAYGNGVGGHHLGAGAGAGVLGTAGSGDGIAVRAINRGTFGDAFGVRAETDSPEGTAIRAVHNPASGGGCAFVAVTNAPLGSGIQAFANDGTAVIAHADTAGTALNAIGQVKFSSAGMATVPLGAAEVTVTPGVPLPATAKILATVNSPQDVGVITVERISNSQFIIVLTAEVAQACKRRLLRDRLAALHR